MLIKQVYIYTEPEKCLHKVKKSLSTIKNCKRMLDCELIEIVAIVVSPDFNQSSVSVKQKT